MTELPNSADPQTQLDIIDHNLLIAQNNQVDVLSPSHFSAAKDARNNAVEARHDAIAANAKDLYPKELEQADLNLRSVTSKIEKNDTSVSQANITKLEDSFRKVEMDSIKKEKLGPAQTVMQEATKEGAAKLTPETLAWANKRYAEDLSVIENNRHNSELVNKASADANQSATRLLKMVRNAKGSSAKNPEQMAKQIEKNELATDQAAQDKVQSTALIADYKNQLATSSDRNDELESKAKLDSQFTKIQGEFTTNEAEVYKQGDKILLRLKGLSFANNKSEIAAVNFPLLTKVQKAIGDIGPSQIQIQGHTDSIGGKKLNEELSAKRAASVQSYLVSNNNVPADKITATGLGDSKPIATNKTAQGRAQNRRVDVIITAEPNLQ